MVTWATPSISEEWIDFELYDCMWYYAQKKSKLMGPGTDWQDGLALHTGLAVIMLLAAPQVWKYMYEV